MAEEVAKLFPELVSYGADGKVETVHYLTLISMLLNELQKRARENQLPTRRRFSNSPSAECKNSPHGRPESE